LAFNRYFFATSNFFNNIFNILRCLFASAFLDYRLPAGLVFYKGAIFSIASKSIRRKSATIRMFFEGMDFLETQCIKQTLSSYLMMFWQMDVFALHLLLTVVKALLAVAFSR